MAEHLVAISKRGDKACRQSLVEKLFGSDKKDGKKHMAEY